MSPNNRTGPLSSFGGYDSIETETVVDDYEMSTFGV